MRAELFIKSLPKKGDPNFGEKFISSLPRPQECGLEGVNGRPTECLNNPERPYGKKHFVPEICQQCPKDSKISAALRIETFNPQKT